MWISMRLNLYESKGGQSHGRLSTHKRAFASSGQLQWDGLQNCRAVYWMPICRCFGCSVSHSIYGWLTRANKLIETNWRRVLKINSQLDSRIRTQLHYLFSAFNRYHQWSLQEMDSTPICYEWQSSSPLEWLFSSGWAANLLSCRFVQIRCPCPVCTVHSLNIICRDDITTVSFYYLKNLNTLANLRG